LASDFPRAPPPPYLPPPTYQPVVSPPPSARPPYPLPARAHVPPTWAGYYFGINGGWGRYNRSETLTISGVPGTTTGNATGYFGGAQIGFNLQSGSLVGGLEADIQGTTMKGDLNSTPGATTGTTKMPWFATGRGRIGVAFDRLLVYATGGAVYGGAKYEGTSFATPFSTSVSFYTWTLGGGLEAALWGRWSVKAEYLYLGAPSKVPFPPNTQAYAYSVHTDIVRAGLNYRF
jgi:outer membrane immunogenic protein